MRRFGHRIVRFASAALLFTAGQHLCWAGSAIWSPRPISSDWKDARNWFPRTVPNGTDDVATFGISQVTDISLTGTTSLREMQFKAGAAAFTINAIEAADLFIGGAGITNDSGALQKFVAEGTGDSSGGIDFSGGATAGKMTYFSIVGGAVFFEDSASAGAAALTVSADASFHQGFILFFGTSTASKAVIEIQPGGVVDLDDNSTADSATFVAELGGGLEFAGISSAATSTSTINPAGVIGFSQFATASGARITLMGAGEGDRFGGAVANFSDYSTLGHAEVVVNGGTTANAPGATLSFFEDAAAGSGTITVNGGTNGGDGGSLIFQAEGDGHTATVKLSGNSQLDISKDDLATVNIGSLEGSGQVFLGARSLTIGSNNRSTTFSGVVQDGGLGGKSGGSLIKAGTGTLTLSGANTYTGGTTLTSGVLAVANTTGSPQAQGA